MAGVSASGSKSTSKSWTQVMNLLRGGQRQSLEDVLGYYDALVGDVLGWKQPEFPGMGPQAANLLSKFGGYGQDRIDYLQKIVDKAPPEVWRAAEDQEFQDFLRANIDQPLAQGLETSRDILGLQGSGGGGYQVGTGQSSGMDRGARELGKDYLDTLARQRTGVTLQERDRQQNIFDRFQQRQDAAGQGILDTLGGMFGMAQQARIPLMEEYAAGEQFRQNQLQAVLGALAGLTGASTAITTGLGQFSKSKSEGGGASASYCHGAAEYFGWYTPMWFAARRWIAEGWDTPTGRRFRDFYFVHSQDVAADIRGSLEARHQWWPLFKWAAEQGKEMD